MQKYRFTMHNIANPTRGRGSWGEHANDAEAAEAGRKWAAGLGFKGELCVTYLPKGSIEHVVVIEDELIG